jgi:hypothetical protein
MIRAWLLSLIFAGAISTNAAPIISPKLAVPANVERANCFGAS